MDSYVTPSPFNIYQNAERAKSKKVAQIYRNACPMHKGGPTYVQYISIIHREIEYTFSTNYLATTGKICFAFEAAASAACASLADFSFRRYVKSTTKRISILSFVIIRRP